MARGGYNGGSTIIYTGNTSNAGFGRIAKKGKGEVTHAPGLHVLTKEESKAVMKKVWASRRRSQALAAKTEADAANFKSAALKKFAADVKKLQSK